MKLLPLKIVLGFLLPAVIVFATFAGLMAALLHQEQQKNAGGDGGDMAMIAYTEWDRGEKDGTHNAGGRKYWKEFGFDGRVEWCGCFAGWCAKQAGLVQGETMPDNPAWAANWISWYDQHPDTGTIHTNDGKFEPPPGALAVNGAKDASWSIHIEVVYECSDGYVTTVGGNCGDRTSLNKYRLGSTWTYFSMPNYPVSSGATPADPSKFVKHLNTGFQHGSLPKDKVKYIVMHDTEAGTSDANAIINGWGNGPVAAHFVVAKDGTIHQCVPINKIAHHAGWGPTGSNGAFGISQERDDMEGADTSGQDYAMNAWSIGIEIVHEHSEGAYPEAQLNAIDSLVAYIDQELGSKPTITDHKEWTGSASQTRIKKAGQGKQDVSGDFPLDKYKSMRAHKQYASGNGALMSGVSFNMSESQFVSEWGKRIDAFYAKHYPGAPLGGEGKNFAKSAYRHHIDPRLVAAISIVESTGGQHCWNSHNAWGWGAADGAYDYSQKWGSWAAGIETVSAGLAKGYSDLKTVEEIGKRYCPPNADKWAKDVKSLMSKI